MIVNGVGTISSSTKPEMKLTLQPDGKVLISSMPGATYTVLPNGESTYNKAKLLQNRKLFLNYKFVSSNGIWHYAKDTLTFRNRIRDGVNEWQDENPAHYN
jgi:hypothetical protein